MYCFGGALSKEEKKAPSVSTVYGWAWADRYNTK